MSTRNYDSFCPPHAKARQIEATVTELTANLDKFKSQNCMTFCPAFCCCSPKTKSRHAAPPFSPTSPTSSCAPSTTCPNEADAALKKQSVQIIIDVDRPGNPVYDDASNRRNGVLTHQRHNRFVKLFLDLYVASARQEGVAHAGKEGIKP
jgi:hypothetical protein